MNHSLFVKIITTLCFFLFTIKIYCQSYYIEQIQKETFVTDSGCFSVKSINEGRIGLVFCTNQMYFSDIVVDTTKVIFEVNFEMKLNNTTGVDTILLKNANIFSFNKSIVFTKSDIDNYDFYIGALKIILNQGNYYYFFEKDREFKRTLCITASFYIPITFLPQVTPINKFNVKD